jgi:hypothetical protein
MTSRYRTRSNTNKIFHKTLVGQIVMKRKHHLKHAPTSNMSVAKPETIKMIVVAGAGASAPLGYSTLFDFESAIAKYAPGTTAKEKRELAYLFQQIRRSLISRGEFSDFEAILWRFSNYLDLCNHLQLDQFLENEFLSTVSDRFRYSAFAQRIGQGQWIVDHIILDHYGHPPQNQEAKQSVFNVLKGLLNRNSGFLDYFTTNYDIGIESVGAIESKDTPFITGIKNPQESVGEWDSTILDITRPNRTGLYIHRLHGCVRWFRRLLQAGSDIKYQIIAKSQLIGDKEWEPCVMYPGRKLNISQPPFADSFIRFRDALSRTECCIIIGTSFRDNNMMEYILEANDRRDTPLPIIIVDISNIKPRFFNKIQEVRNVTHFHYNRTEWRVKFIVGDYTDYSVHEELLSVLENLGSIKIINENSTEP